MIELKSVCKSFEGRTVLEDISTVFENGKTNLIIGQSGSGKTVLMKSIVGLLTPEQGEILYDGRNFLNMNKKEMIARDRLKRARFCLDRVNLGEAQQKYPGEISGGMQKRVAIARAIALQPQYLVCDEPNSGLDPKTSLVIDELIHSITTEYNMTTIINTHDMNSVLGIGDSILFIYEGRQEWQGTKEEIFTSSNRRLNDFIFASDLLKKVKDMEMTTREG